MSEVMNTISTFVMGTSIWVYLFIFFGKMLEVSLCTLRIVLINRGIRTIGAVIAFIEMMLWLIVASSVLDGFREDFLKGLIYAVAFAIGNYVGSWLDERLAFGLCSVQVIISDDAHAKIVAEALRAKGFGVTSMQVQGREENHYMLMMTMERKHYDEAFKYISQLCPKAVISTSDVKAQKGSYLRKRKGHFIKRLSK